MPIIKVDQCYTEFFKKTSLAQFFSETRYIYRMDANTDGEKEEGSCYCS